MAVNISGTVLASLFYDQSSSFGDQIGFLVGDVLQHVTDTISDSQINNVAVETKMFVYDCISCARDQRFFRSNGEILFNKIVNSLKLDPKKIVGWYSFRRHTTLRPSFRERLLHQNLSSRLGGDPGQFLFMLCTGKASSNRSTHTFDHCFVQLHDSSFKRVLATVVNLGETTHTEYKYLPSHTVSSGCGLYSDTVSRQQNMFLNSSGQMEIKSIQTLYGALNKQLQDISGAVVESEVSVSELEAQVQQMRCQVQRRLLEKKQQLQQQHGANKSGLKPAASTFHGIVHPQAATKKPSVDDLLFMDCSDTPTHEPLVTHGDGLSHGKKLVNSEGASGKVPVVGGSDGTVMARQSCDKGGKSDVTDSTTQIAKLTAPTIIHTRSSSTPADQVKAASPRTRSKSGDSNSTTVPGKNVNLSVKDTDPFSFVSSLIKEPTKDHGGKKGTSLSLKNTRSGEQTNQEVSKDSVTQKRSTRGSEAVLAAAKSLSSKSNGDNSSSVLHTTNKAKPSARVESDQSKQPTNQTGSNGKPCSQEAGLGVKGPDLSGSDPPSSQDTYEMELSSSPVY